MEINSFGYIVVGLIGLIMGSFAGATVWRLRGKQLVEDKNEGERVDAKELKRLKPLTKSRLRDDHSRCLSCGHQLRWYDLLPLVSWLSTNGKCRYCKQTIGYFEPLIELGTASLFIWFYSYWLASGGMFMSLELVLWLVMLTMFVILFVYDLKWFLLPDSVMIPLLALSGGYSLFSIATAASPLQVAFSTIGAVIALSGIYFLLWVVSKGNWIGFGDVKLGAALGLLLMDWKLGLLALFLANLIGTFIVLPGLLTKKLSRGSHVPFGPLLIAGFFIALFYGDQLIDFYLQSATTLML